MDASVPATGDLPVGLLKKAGAWADSENLHSCLQDLKDAMVRTFLRAQVPSVPCVLTSMSPAKIARRRLEPDGGISCARDQAGVGAQG